MNLPAIPTVQTENRSVPQLPQGFLHLRTRVHFFLTRLEDFALPRHLILLNKSLLKFFRVPIHHYRQSGLD